jgi:hypothetical protein
VQLDGGKTNLIYGRIHGTPYAQVEGGIYGWPFYNAKGPAGLNPGRYYVLNPAVKRPAAFFSSSNLFSPSLYEGFVEEGFANEDFAYIKIKPREDILNIITYDSVVLHAADAPKVIYVNGVITKAHAVTNGQWKIDFQLDKPITIVAILKDAPAIAELGTNAVARTVGNDWAIDQYAASTGPKAEGGLKHVTVQAPADQGKGTLVLDVSAYLTVGRVEYNGIQKSFNATAGANYTSKTTISIPMEPGEQGLLSVYSGGRLGLGAKWVPVQPDSTNAPAAK